MNQWVKSSYTWDRFSPLGSLLQPSLRSRLQGRPSRWKPIPRATTFHSVVHSFHSILSTSVRKWDIFLLIPFFDFVNLIIFQNKNKTADSRHIWIRTRCCKIGFQDPFYAKQLIYIWLEIRFPRNLTEFLCLTSLNYKNQEIWRFTKMRLSDSLSKYSGKVVRFQNQLNSEGSKSCTNSKINFKPAPL